MCRLSTNRKSADLVVSIIGMENQTERTNLSLGYIASIVVMTPCSSTNGTAPAQFDMEGDHLLNSAGHDVGVLIENVVSALNSKDFEDVRQSHASIKEYLDRQKKH